MGNGNLGNYSPCPCPFLSGGLRRPPQPRGYGQFRPHLTLAHPRPQDYLQNEEKPPGRASRGTRTALRVGWALQQLLRGSLHVLTF